MIQIVGSSSAAADVLIKCSDLNHLFPDVVDFPPLDLLFDLQLNRLDLYLDSSDLLLK